MAKTKKATSKKVTAGSEIKSSPDAKNRMVSLSKTDDGKFLISCPDAQFEHIAATEDVANVVFDYAVASSQTVTPEFAG